MDMLRTLDSVISAVGSLLAAGLLYAAYRLMKSAVDTKQCHMH